MQIPHLKGRRLFFRGAKARESAVVNRVLDFSLPGKKRCLFFFLLGSAMVAGHESAPILVSKLYLFEVSA